MTDKKSKQPKRGSDGAKADLFGRNKNRLEESIRGAASERPGVNQKEVEKELSKRLHGTKGKNGKSEGDTQQDKKGWSW